MIGLFRTLIIFAVIYLIVRLVTRTLLPLLLGTYVNQKVSEAQQNSSKQHKKNREGEVTLNYTSPKDKKYDPKAGEYVDFEEIKE
jgi:hypothetical protein